MIKKALLCATVLAGLASNPACAAPDVVVSIPPLHSLTSAVMKDVATPTLLVEGAQSPHSFTLKPSDAAKVQQADIVFWISPELESFLPKSLAALNPKALSITMDQNDTVEEAHGHADHHDQPKDKEPHDDHHDHAESPAHVHEHAHDHGGKDLHLWLNPDHALEMVEKIETALIKADPDNAELYHKNTHDLENRLKSLDRELESLLSPVKHKPFVVFHDAYGHLQEKYHLTIAGTVTLAAHKSPGAKRIREIQQSLAEKKVQCVFSEPQFQTKMVQTLIEGTAVKTAVLDPLGADIPAGPDHYETLMRTLGTTISDCLSQ